MTAEEFRRWYEGRGLTQEQIAALLGIRAGKQRVSEWATGRRPVPPYIAEHCATLDRLRECEEGKTNPEVG